MPDDTLTNIVLLHPPTTPREPAPDVTAFPSAFDIGAPVYVDIQGARLLGYIRAVTFTRSKVRYAVKVYLSAEEEAVESPGVTTLHNVDSALVTGREGHRREIAEFDNYS